MDPGPVTSSRTGDATGMTGYTEYGAPRTQNTGDSRHYGWLGTSQRASDSIGGSV
ncbi:hypothetical protein GCM10022224_026640 [Nonomuraea antimicrobica]|uniref:Uncharacterized protein n=1 Tax=Nonomuraea antimicrobica TaxID=561173 RepID=A0ABP7BKS8_9ACTN